MTNDGKSMCTYSATEAWAMEDSPSWRMNTRRMLIGNSRQRGTYVCANSIHAAKKAASSLMALAVRQGMNTSQLTIFFRLRAAQKDKEREERDVNGSRRKQKTNWRLVSDAYQTSSTSTRRNDMDGPVKTTVRSIPVSEFRIKTSADTDRKSALSKKAGGLDTSANDTESESSSQNDDDSDTESENNYDPQFETSLEPNPDKNESRISIIFDSCDFELDSNTRDVSGSRMYNKFREFVKFALSDDRSPLMMTHDEVRRHTHTYTVPEKYYSEPEDYAGKPLRADQAWIHESDAYVTSLTGKDFITLIGLSYMSQHHLSSYIRYVENEYEDGKRFIDDLTHLIGNVQVYPAIMQTMDIVGLVNSILLRDDSGYPHDDDESSIDTVLQWKEFTDKCEEIYNTYDVYHSNAASEGENDYIRETLGSLEELIERFHSIYVGVDERIALWSLVFQRYLTDALRIFRNAPGLQSDMLVFRGIHGEGMLNNEFIVENGQLTTKYFMSTSLNPKHALRYSDDTCCLMRIIVPAGQSAIFASSSSVYGKDEAEVKIPRGVEMIPINDCSIRLYGDTVFTRDRVVKVFDYIIGV